MAPKPTYVELSHAKPEPHRRHRQGFPEAIYCPGKTPEQIQSIFDVLMKGPGPVMATRIDSNTAETLVAQYPQALYSAQAKLVVAKGLKRRKGKSVCVITAGTADIPVAEEACLTAESLGCPVRRLFDVGVSGIHRLLSNQKVFASCSAIVVCAGMEGALASVVGGLVSCPVIAVPTSVGYGAHFQGIAPLLTMLNSCAPNVSVVNIDNGFGAGIMASLIAR